MICDLKEHERNELILVPSAIIYTTLLLPSYELRIRSHRQLLQK
jgi:hypothetical protein